MICHSDLSFLEFTLWIQVVVSNILFSLLPGENDPIWLINMFQMGQPTN